MSANLFEDRCRFESRRFQIAGTPGARVKPREAIRRRLIPSVTTTEEITFMTWAVIGMVVLGVTPLIVFHVIHYLSSFVPNL